MDQFHTIASQLLRNTVQQMIAQGDFKGSQNDVDIFVKLCIMVINPLGNENPHDLIRAMSDDIIDQIIEKKSQIENNPTVGAIYQFFEIEHEFRGGKLEDWTWQWDNPTSGHIAYKPKEKS